VIFTGGLGGEGMGKRYLVDLGVASRLNFVSIEDERRIVINLWIGITIHASQCDAIKRTGDPPIREKEGSRERDKRQGCRTINIRDKSNDEIRFAFVPNP
jgi:hypothetical protein